MGESWINGMTWPVENLTVSLYTDDPDSFAQDVREMSLADGTVVDTAAELAFKMSSGEDIIRAILKQRDDARKEIVAGSTWAW